MPANGDRLQTALDELQAEMMPARKRRGKTAGDQSVFELTTVAGHLKVVSMPAGLPDRCDISFTSWGER
ncbi:MAG TPA: hypothetical protein VGI50_17015 [Solirubrobacteraceae bacterium]